jgi:hypothetical protein
MEHFKRKAGSTAELNKGGGGKEKLRMNFRFLVIYQHGDNLRSKFGQQKVRNQESLLAVFSKCLLGLY